MLLYAWDLFDELKEQPSEATPYSAPLDLLASVLIHRTEKILRTGLDRGYRDQTQELFGVRGRINVSQSVRSRGLLLGRLVCEFDELDHAVLHNQVIRSTLARLAKVRGLDPSLAETASSLMRRMADVELVVLSERVFDRVVLHRNTAQYRLPIQVCHLLYRQLIPVDQTGHFRFKEFDDDNLATLYEQFLRNFYKREQTTFHQVKRERFSWQNALGESEALAYLPQMETDISLLSHSTRLVIDAKFYTKSMSSRFADSGKKIIPSHLWQMSAYLRNLALMDTRTCSALLLYPRVDHAFDLQYRLLDHDIRVATIDLTLEPHELRQQLLAFVVHGSKDMRGAP